MEEVAIAGDVFQEVGLAVARNAIARAILNESAPVPTERDSRPADLGSITLKPQQRSAVKRLREVIAEFGGALLCDPVGTGKTYVAMAVAGPGARILVVAPAVLREMWLVAARVTEREIQFRSFEALSRGSGGDPRHDVLIVDEAHHARNPSTRRFAELSRLASTCPVVLLSATPIHNRRIDLLVLLSLFLGERAHALTGAELGRCVVRRENESPSARSGIPEIEPLRWYDLPEDDRIPRLLLALQPPLPPRDGGDGGVLIALSLIRLWASSDAALEGGLRRRLHRSLALIAALESDTYPSRAELAAWTSAEDSIQLAFPELVASSFSETTSLLQVVRANRDSLVEAMGYLRHGWSRDDERAALIRRVRNEHPGNRIVAFSQYADTVEAMFGRLARDGRVAALTGAGARVAGGAISRDEAIGRFAPNASRRAPPSRSNAVTLLLTTDLLSEGVNLQDANVVLHLDLPWTPARMEQRLGRIARLGSEHERVHSYAIRPPASASAITGIEEALRRKVKSAGIVIDRFPSLLSDFTQVEVTPSGPRLVEGVRESLARWLDGSEPPQFRGAPLASSVSARRDGFLAACRAGGRMMLIGSLGGRIGDDPAIIRECVELAGGDGPAAVACEFQSSLRSLRSHIDAATALSGIRSSTPCVAHRRADALRRIAAAVHQARPHDRPRVAALSERAGVIVRSRYGAHAERELAELGALGLGDERWLEAVIDFGARFGASPVVSDITAGEYDPTILAIIVLCAGAQRVEVLTQARKR